MDKHITFLKKAQRRHESRRGYRDDDEHRRGAKLRTTPCTGIEENRNAKQCRNWIRARAGEIAAKRGTTMSAGEGPSAVE
jgi:hypothetical protein